MVKCYILCVCVNVYIRMCVYPLVLPVTHCNGELNTHHTYTHHSCIAHAQIFQPCLTTPAQKERWPHSGHCSMVGSGSVPLTPPPQPC